MQLLEKVIAGIAPHNCIVCSREGSLVCAWCAPDFCSPLPPRCYKCHALTPDSQTCEKCRRHSPLRHVWAASELVGAPKQLIHAFKFERTQAAALAIGSFMNGALPYMEDVLFIPIPTATSRLRKRGYDHTKLLARSVAQSRRQPMLPALARQGQTRQVGASRNIRLTQLEGMFRVTRRNVTGRHIILVDDVLTTGATLETAARTLKKAGAKRVDGLVFAQKH